MRLIHTLLLLLALPSLGAAAGLVTNSEFKDASGWTLPANSGWRIADDDGRSDASALRYQGLTATAAAPVTRQVNVGQQADYVLTAWAKSDGKLRPTITIEGLGSASAAAVPANTWQPLTIRFNSGDRKQVELRLVADSEATVPVGTSTFDEVQIWLATELPANVRQAAQPGPGGKNIALGASYTLDPAPNYGLCTDPGDRVQLTDGTLSEGYFWTQQGTVGWTRGKPLIVKLDLGQRRPIRGASLNSAAGRAGVTWPAAILLYTSDDNQSWVRAGELINLSGKHGDAPAEGYAVHRYWTGDLATAGRYFAFVIASGGPYFFVDEVEVFEGPETLLTATPAEAPVLDLKSAFLSETISTALTHQVASDLRAVRAMLAEAKLPAAEQRRLAAELTAAEADRKVALTAAD
ncbi:MAG: hypothetical protein HUU35_08960, partial [Armatimonadetes bacterium]|nr:hypothetical protein [Armatimonadota bacterium]